MEKFEYKTFVYSTKGFMGGLVYQDELQNQLNFLGNDGWELVSSVPTTEFLGASKSIVFTFKRKKAN